jgi:alpha-L-rhamnosidase
MAECVWKIEAEEFVLDVVIPPNTTALVTLPGSDTDAVEVGSGTWHWAVPYQDPDARGPYTVDDLIGDIAYHQPARDAIRDVLDRAGAPEFLTRIVLNERNTPLREALQMLPNHKEAAKMMNEALASL